MEISRPQGGGIRRRVSGTDIFMGLHRELDRLGGPSVFFLGSSEVQAIHQARPDVLWVVMTAPKQEKWVHRHRDRLDVRFFFTPPVSSG